MTFPIKFTVGHRVHSYGPENGWGDPVSTWAEPVQRGVYGWGAPATRETPDLLITDVQVYVPPGFTCDPRDRMVLDGEEYEVVGGPQMNDHNPLSDWNPGGVINLRRAT